MADINIGGRLHSTATGNVIAGANEIYDDTKGKKQSVINEETDNRVETLEQSVGEGGSVDQRINEEGAKHYLKEETYNKSELNNMITTPDQTYVTVTATDQTTSATDVLPAEGNADTIYRVGNWDGTQYNDSVFSEYAWNGSAYIKLSTKSQVGEVYDISVNHADTKYADLAAALGTNGANIPQSLRKGGMSVKFVQSSDNKYVQYRLMSDTFNTTVANWQGVDDEPTAGSDNLVKSSGVLKEITSEKMENTLFKKDSVSTLANYIYFNPVVGKTYYVENLNELNSAMSVRVGSTKAEATTSSPLAQTNGRVSFTATADTKVIYIFTPDIANFKYQIRVEGNPVQKINDLVINQNSVLRSIDSNNVELTFEQGGIYQNGIDGPVVNNRIRNIGYISGNKLLKYSTSYTRGQISAVIFKYDVITHALINRDITPNVYSLYYLEEGYIYRIQLNYSDDSEISPSIWSDMISVYDANGYKQAFDESLYYKSNIFSTPGTYYVNLPVLYAGRKYYIVNISEDDNTQMSFRFIDKDGNVLLGPITADRIENDGIAYLPKEFYAVEGIDRIQLYGTAANSQFLLTSDDTIFNRLDNLERYANKQEFLPDYWQAYMDGDDENEGKINILIKKDMQCGNEGDSFVFITDIHTEYNHLKSPALIKYILNCTATKKVVCGGDIINGNDTTRGLEYLRMWFDKMGFCDQIYVRGNHDCYVNIDPSVAVDLNYSEYYGRYLKRIQGIYNNTKNINYSFENEVQKILYVVLDTYNDYPNWYDNFRQQLVWMQGLAAQKGNDWKIVIFTHIFYYWHEGQDVNNPYRHEVYADETITVINNINADTNSAKVIALIAGHMHTDIVTYTGNVPLISTTCDGSFTVASVFDSRYPNRVYGTTTEQAFDVYHIDLANSKLYATRIGAGVDRIMNLQSNNVSVGSSITLSPEDSGTNTWYIHDESIATIEDGVITGVSAGNTWVSATAGNGTIEYFSIKVI